MVKNAVQKPSCIAPPLRPSPTTANRTIAKDRNKIQKRQEDSAEKLQEEIAVNIIYLSKNSPKAILTSTSCSNRSMKLSVKRRCIAAQIIGNLALVVSREGGGDCARGLGRSGAVINRR
ncbi:predicted protein [Chaetomium globosum CBS 148.51]|uniref:Uncharacterized protein n=1 Tax=Chaetomium globosum (strain ATCC 6205 / CBS 148.51 / DSM 1962 / NBRC 6347 / NRRL 1970) TaxID=306901 RepID=Q2GUC1_CHAGB|nr:uncharacterized protein CHGG_08433 [Chaetomium globosum CBS 148.51]EAQ84419.1 predicted protein [Chaetomium globosum CBS 148.51]